MTLPDVENYFDLESHGDNKAVIDSDGVSLSYAELLSKSNKLATQLPDARQVVFILANNTIDTLVAYLACLRHRHVALLIDENIAANLLDRLIEQYAPNFISSRAGDAVLTCLNDVRHKLHPDLALMLSTSGSTGSPKLVRLSYDNLQKNALAISQYLPISEADSAITALPFCYSYGLSVINSHLLCGARLAMTQEVLVSKNFWTLFRRAEVNSLAGVPFSFRLLKQMRFERMEFPHLKYLTQAGGRLAQEEWHYLSELSESKQLPIYAMYGQTEATARMAYLPPAMFSNLPGCIGQPIPGGSFRLEDEGGQAIKEDNTVGELVYHGPNVMMGYAESITDFTRGQSSDRLETGDLAYRKQGLYFIEGRLSRFIKITGLRINLDDIEAFFAGRHINVLAAGYDDKMLLAVDDKTDADGLAVMLQQAFNISLTYIIVKTFKQLPLLSSGKPDYQSLVNRIDSGCSECHNVGENNDVA